MAERLLKRAKRRFPTARAAWTDIRKDEGLTAKAVVRKRHTRSHWGFVVRRGRL